MTLDGSLDNQTKQPAVSVVVPFYNRFDLLDLTLQSIRLQSFEAYEVIMVDDGSTDGSREVARKYEALDRRFKYVSQENGGCASARNHGFALSNADSAYVIFLDSDDIWTPNALETLVSIAELHPDLDIFFSPWNCIDLIDENGVEIKETGKPKSTYAQSLSKFFGKSVSESDICEEPLLYMSAANLFYSPGAVLVRRSILPVVPFNQELKNCEDWDLWIRLCVTSKLKSVDQHFFLYRKHAGAKSNDKARMAQHREMIYARLVVDKSIPAKAIQVIKEGQVRHCLSDSVHYTVMAIDAASHGKLKNAFSFAYQSMKYWNKARAVRASYNRSDRQSSIMGSRHAC